MKKQLLIIRACAVGVAAAVYSCGGHGDTDEGVYADNRIEATMRQEGIINEPATQPVAQRIYIDNSVSMRPYFMGDSCAIINTITELRNLENSGTQIFLNGDKKPLTGFFAPAIKKNIGKISSGNSDFPTFFSAAADSIDNNSGELIYLVTDGILSIGPGNMDQVLREMRGRITGSLKGHPGLAAAIFRYLGDYKGYYYNRLNKSTKRPLDQQRPYYVIALGNADNIRWLASKSDDELNNPDDKLFFGIHDLKGHATTRIADPGDGAYLQYPDSAARLEILLPECLKNLSKSDILENLEIETCGEDYDGNELYERRVITSQYPEKLILLIDNSHYNYSADEDITVKLENFLPDAWETTYNAADDLGDTVSTGTTYGLGTLVKGIYEAFETDDDDLIKLTFKYKY